MSQGTTSGQTIVIFQNRTTNGTSAPVLLNYGNCKCIITAYGTWNGASIALFSFGSDGTTQIPVTDYGGNVVTFTANRSFELTAFVYNQPLIATISSAGGATNLTMTLQPTSGGL